MQSIPELMRNLNNAERRAVRAYKVLTHAYYTTASYDQTAADLMLYIRHERIVELRSSAKARMVASAIEAQYWNSWCDEAKKAGLR